MEEAGPSKIVDRRVDLSKELDAPSTTGSRTTPGAAATAGSHTAVLANVNSSSGSSLARLAASDTSGEAPRMIDLAGPSEAAFVPIASPPPARATLRHRAPKRKRATPLQVPGTIAAWQPDLFRSLGVAASSVELCRAPSAVSLISTPEDATATYHRLYAKAAEHLRHFWPMQSKRALSPASSQRLRKIVSALRELKREAEGLEEALPRLGEVGHGRRA